MCGGWDGKKRGHQEHLSEMAPVSQKSAESPQRRCKPAVLSTTQEDGLAVPLAPAIQPGRCGASPQVGWRRVGTGAMRVVLTLGEIEPCQAL